MKRLLIIFSTILLILFFIGFQPGKSVEKLKKKYATAESQFWDYEGMPIHYRITGEGEPLVLLHGVASCLHTWTGWHEELSADFQVISLDLPSFGLTGPNPDGDYSVEMYMAFIDAFRAHLGLDKIYLAGNSFGGFLTWNYANHNSEAVKKMILLDAAGMNTDHKDVKDIGFKLSMHPIAKHLTWVYTPKFLVAKSVRNVYGDQSKVDKQLIQLYYDHLVRDGNRKGFSTVLGETILNGSEHITTLKKITTPTLIMWGERDNLIPVADASSFADYLPDSELKIYEGIGHVPMEEIPERSASDARSFLLKNNNIEQVEEE